MRIDIEFVDFQVLQDQLDQTMGLSLFTVGVDKNTVPRQVYLEPNDQATAEQISQAQSLAADLAQQQYQAVQRDMYDRIDRAAAKTLDRRMPRPYSAQQVALAQTWLADPATLCPEFIQDRAFLQATTQTAIAQQVVDDLARYQEFVQQVTSVRQSGKAAILSAQTFYQVKLAGTEAMNQLTVLEAQNQE